MPRWVVVSALLTVVSLGVTTPASAGSCIIADPGSPSWKKNRDVLAIVQIARDLEKAMKTEDAAQVADFYSPDVVYMADGRPDAHGRDTVAKSWSQMLETFHMELTVEIEEVGVCGDIAFDRAVFTSAMTAKTGGTPRVQKGRLLEILKKEEGKWRSWRVMVNGEEPPLIRQKF